MRHIITIAGAGIVLLTMLAASGCSHKFNADVLDLGFYQWNMWPDVDAAAAEAADQSASKDGHVPSCGWEAFHRGKGKLVRIPATPEEYFPVQELTGITWFHCRYTLPEIWEDRKIGLQFEGISHQAEIYLNGEVVGTYRGEGGPFNIDVSEIIYYTRDNHLSVRVFDPGKGSGGLTGTVLVTSTDPVTEPE